MPSYFVRKRSFREVRRFSAIDQDGVPHRLVERIEMWHGVGASGCVVDAEQGVSNFYSATSGDAVMRQGDGSFATTDGKLRLKADPQAA